MNILLDTRVEPIYALNEIFERRASFHVIFNFE